MRKIWNSIKAFYNNTYGMLIIISWILFIICLIIKLFGGNWFELGTSNEKFNMFCEYVDTTKVLKKVIACLIYLFTGYPIICILLNKSKLDNKSTLIFIPLMVCKSLVSWHSILISILVRNISLDFNVGNTIIENYLVQVDYYLMVILFYLYYFKSKNKEIK